MGVRGNAIGITPGEFEVSARGRVLLRVMLSLVLVHGKVSSLCHSDLRLLKNSLTVHAEGAGTDKHDVMLLAT